LRAPRRLRRAGAHPECEGAIMSRIDEVSVSDEWERAATGTHHDPHMLLGAHPVTGPAGRTITVIRTRRPLAESVTAVFLDGDRLSLQHVARGIWEGRHAGTPSAYRIATVYAGH